MKNSHVCTKCGSQNIFIEKSKRRPEKENNLYSSIKIGIFASATFQRFCCMDCGYSESWLTPKGLKKLRKKRKFATPPKEPKAAVQKSTKKPTSKA